MQVGNKIVLGQDGYQCTWFVSTPTSSEHFVSSSPIMVIDPASMDASGLYNCYINGVLMLSCQVNVFNGWGKYHLQFLFCYIYRFLMFIKIGSCL